MSYHVFFDFSTGLSKAIRVPKGTFERCVNHVRDVEKKLGLETTQYQDNPPHWKSTTPQEGVTDEVFCEVATDHNRFVRHLYGKLEEWSKTIFKTANSELLTPSKAAQFWHGLRMIGVPPHRWTRDYYRDRMEHVYEVLRGVESEGCTFGAKRLTIKQAAAVIRVFEQYLDKHDLRLDVPNGHDMLKSSYDGGYVWCEKCGPVDSEEVDTKSRFCRRRQCPIKAEYGSE